MQENFINKNNPPPDLWPEIYGLKSSIVDIFPVPEENAVATNDLDNSLQC